MTDTTTEAVDALPIETAPRDGTLLRLLVDYTDEGENPLEDEHQAWTIGLNEFYNNGEDVWEFAGWSWEQDCFTAGIGKVIGWLPFHPSSRDLVPALLAERDALKAKIDMLKLSLEVNLGILADVRELSDCINADYQELLAASQTPDPVTNADSCQPTRTYEDGVRAAAAAAAEYARQPATGNRDHDAGWDNAAICIDRAILALIKEKSHE